LFHSIKLNSGEELNRNCLLKRSGLIMDFGGCISNKYLLYY
jgi:hypothetical protein